MTSFQELLMKAREEIQEIDPPGVQAKLENKDAFLLLDVRGRDEYHGGYLPGAINLPRGFLELKIEQLVPDRGQEIVLYCAGGIRSVLAAKTLQDMGYEKVFSMAGGFGGWRQCGLPVTNPGTPPYGPG